MRLAETFIRDTADEFAWYGQAEGLVGREDLFETSWEGLVGRVGREVYVAAGGLLGCDLCVGVRFRVCESDGDEEGKGEKWDLHGCRCNTAAPTLVFSLSDATRLNDADENAMQYGEVEKQIATISYEAATVRRGEERRFKVVATRTSAPRPDW